MEGKKKGGEKEGRDELKRGKINFCYKKIRTFYNVYILKGQINLKDLKSMYHRRKQASHQLNIITDRGNTFQIKSNYFHFSLKIIF